VKEKHVQDTSFPHLFSFFPAPLFSALLVSRSVTAQAPFDNSNNDNNNCSSNTNNNITPAAKETQELKAKKKIPLSTLSDREQFF
jgi:hypothetical protein